MRTLAAVLFQHPTPVQTAIVKGLEFLLAGTHHQKRQMGDIVKRVVTAGMRITSNIFKLAKSSKYSHA